MLKCLTGTGDCKKLKRGCDTRAAGGYYFLFKLSGGKAPPKPTNFVYILLNPFIPP